MKESYTIILNSQIATNQIIINNETSMQYYINWESVLPYSPDRKQKFKLSFSLRTVPNVGALTESAFVEIVMGQTHSNEQNGTTNIIGVVSPHNVHNSHYLIALPNDNMPVQVEYPSSSLITVNFLNLDKITAFDMIHYVLILTFEEL
jgi:hypothetical protein